MADPQPVAKPVAKAFACYRCVSPYGENAPGCIERDDVSKCVENAESYINNESGKQFQSSYSCSGVPVLKKSEWKCPTTAAMLVVCNGNIPEQKAEIKPVARTIGCDKGVDRCVVEAESYINNAAGERFQSSYRCDATPVLKKTDSGSPTTTAIFVLCTGELKKK